MKHWRARLTIEVTADIDADESWDRQGIEEIAQDSINVSTTSTGVTLSLEYVSVDSVAEVGDEG